MFVRWLTQCEEELEKAVVWSWCHTYVTSSVVSNEVTIPLISLGSIRQLWAMMQVNKTHCFVTISDSPISVSELNVHKMYYCEEK